MINLSIASELDPAPPVSALAPLLACPEQPTGAFLGRMRERGEVELLQGPWAARQVRGGCLNIAVACQ
jgi:hypothetical protein